MEMSLSIAYKSVFNKGNKDKPSEKHNLFKLYKLFNVYKHTQNTAYIAYTRRSCVLTDDLSLFPLFSV